MAQPVIERRLAAVELQQFVLGDQGNGRLESRRERLRRPAYFCHAGVRASSAFSFGPGAGGLSRAATNAS